MRYFCLSLLLVGLLLAGCSGSKDAAEDEPDAEEEQVDEGDPGDEDAEDTGEDAEEEEPVAVPISPIVGNWEGSLSLPDGSTLRVLFHIKQDRAGVLSATLDSPDQGALEIPVDEVRFEDGALYLYLQVIEGSYTGTLREETEAIEGTWTQPGGTLPLNMERVEDES